MAQFSTQGGKGVLARSALLSCEYSGERLHFIVCEGRSSMALTLLCTSTPGVSKANGQAGLFDELVERLRVSGVNLCGGFFSPTLTAVF